MIRAKKGLLIAGIALVCLAAFLLILLLPRGEDLSKPVRRAAHLIKSAQKAEKTSYARALRLYEQALATLEDTTANLKEDILPQIRLKAEAEEDPLTCADFIARTLAKPEWVAWALCDIGAAYFESGQNKKASQTFSQARREANKTTDEYEKALVLTHVAIKHAEAGQPDEASVIFSQALQAADRVAPPSGGTVSDVQSSQKQAPVGKPNGAHELTPLRRRPPSKGASGSDLHGATESETGGRPVDFQNLEPWLRKEMALSIMVMFCADAGQYDMAVQAAQMQRRLFRKYYDLKRIAEKCLSGGNRDKALEVLSQLHRVAKNRPKGFERNNSLSGVAPLYAQAGEYDLALEIAEAIPVAWARLWALTEIASSYAKSGQKEKASDLVKKLHSMAESEEDPDRKAQSLANMASAYGAVGQYEEALSLAGQIDSDFWKMNTLLDILRECTRSGPKRETLRVLRHGIDVLRPIKYGKTEALCGVARGYFRIGENQKGDKVLRELLRDADKQSGTKERGGFLASVAQTYTEAGNYDRAIRIAKQIPTTLNNATFLADLLVEAGRYEQAVEAAGRIKAAERKGQALSDIASKLAEAGKYTEALRVARTIKSRVWKTTALTNIGSVYAKSGQKPGPAETKVLHEMISEFQ